MTPGNNGASTPEDDDPFGYLYADGQANGATPPSGGGGYGYPGSVNRSRAVGQRQYGQQQGGYGQQQQAAPTAPYGQAPQQGQYGQQQPGYGQQSAHYAAPETVPGGATTSRQASVGTGGGGRGRGPNTKGLLIGAIAVVAAVVIGIAIAMTGGDSNDDKSDSVVGSTPSASQSASASESTGQSGGSEAELPKIDAKALNLGAGVTTATDVKGAQADGGTYVSGLNAPGAQVTWTVNGIPEDGAYTLFARYSVAGADAKMTLTVNGKVFGSKLNMTNFTHAADGDFAKGWTKTYAYPTLSKGTNTISLSCGDGDSCNVLLDQFSLKRGQVKS